MCSGNAHRSPLSEAILKKLRPDIIAESAGLQISIPISSEVKKYLARIKADQYLKLAPESIQNKDLTSYDLIVAMGPEHKNAILSKCPSCEARIVVWNVQDPYFLPPQEQRQVYDQIRMKVADLSQNI